MVPHRACFSARMECALRVMTASWKYQKKEEGMQIIVVWDDLDCMQTTVNIIQQKHEEGNDEMAKTLKNSNSASLQKLSP